MEVELMNGVLCLRFDGRTTTVSDEEHVAAFKRLLALPNVAELFLQPAEHLRLSNYLDEDDDGCPHGFAWFNDGIWSADPADADQAPWIVIERDDMRDKYEGDLAAARDNFVDVRWVLFGAPESSGGCEELHCSSESVIGVVIARKPGTTAAVMEYTKAVVYLPVLLRNSVGTNDQRARLARWLEAHHPHLSRLP